MRRYDLICKKVIEFLKFQKINQYPLNLFDLIDKNGWQLIAYSESDGRFMRISEDGFSRYLEKIDSYGIFYNKDRVEPRIKFTLSHEIAHIILGHHFITTGDILSSDDSYHNEIEQEANEFAGQLLCPAPIINNLYIADTDYLDYRFDNNLDKCEYCVNILANTFDVSIEVALIRLKRFSNDLQHIERRDFSLFQRATEIINDQIETEKQHFFSTGNPGVLAL